MPLGLWLGKLLHACIKPRASQAWCAAAPPMRWLQTPAAARQVRRPGSCAEWVRVRAEGATVRSARAAGYAPALPPLGVLAAASPPAPAQTAPLPAAAARRNSGTRGCWSRDPGWAEGWALLPGAPAGAAAWVGRSWGWGGFVERSPLPAHLGHLLVSRAGDIVEAPGLGRLATLLGEATGLAGLSWPHPVAADPRSRQPVC